MVQGIDENSKIKEVIIHVGINDIMNGIPTHNIITNISRSVNHLKSKLPESTVVISELVAANYRLVKEANEELRKLANTIYVGYSRHHPMRDKFVDERHVNR